MAWEDNLLPAMLDDAPFLYRSVRDRGGRRTVQHQFPGRDDPYIEDLGKNASTYQVEAFVLGEDYLQKLQELLDVLDTPGTRIFQHPYRGTFLVKLIGDYEVEQNDQEGRMARISFTLMESGLAFPLIALDTVGKLAKISFTGLDALARKTKFSLLGAIKDVIDSVLNALGTALSVVNAVNGKIAAAFSLIDTAAFLLDELAAGLTDLVNSPFDLMNKLSNLLDAVFDLIALFVQPITDPDVVIEPIDKSGIFIETFTELFEIVMLPEGILTNTPQRTIEETALAAASFHFKAATVAVAAEAMTLIPLASSDEAAELLTMFASAFDVVLGTEDIDHEVFESFAAMKAATIEHLTAVQQNLPALTTYETRQTLPALVIAHELYGDATRDEEIVRRNKVRHPGFVPGGLTLEVLADD